MPSTVPLVVAVALVLVAVVLIVIAVRRNGWRGTPASMRERVLIYTPITLCVFVAGLLLLRLGEPLDQPRSRPPWVCDAFSCWLADSSQ